MKRYIIFFCGICTVVFGRSQSVMKISQTTTVRANGNVSIVAQDLNIANDGTFSNTSDASIVFSGNSPVVFNGAGNTILGQLHLQKNNNSILKLGQNIQVLDRVQFNSGVLDLDNFIIDLGATGFLNGESESSRAFTNGLGLIQLTKTLNNVSSANPGNLGAVISTTANMGSTIIRRGGAAQSNLGPNHSIQRYFDILPQNNSSLNATLRFYYLNAELSGIDQNALSLWKSTDNVNWTAAGLTSSNTVDKYVEKTAISSFSRWTLGPFAPVTIAPPANITVNADPNVCEATITLIGNYAATATGSPTPAIAYKIGNTVINTTYTFPKGVTTVTAIASNGVSTDATTSFSVTVVDQQKPTITCPSYAMQCNIVSGIYQLPTLVATDNCGTPNFSYVVSGATTRSGNGNNASGSFNAGTSIIDWTVTDASGNISTCSASFVINPAVNAIVPDAYAFSPGAAVNTVYIGYATKITLNSQVSGGSSPYTYKWTAGSSAGQALSTSASFAVSPTTTTTYYFNAKDKFGCTAPAVAKTVQVVDVRCGTKLDKVTVCVLSKGIYTTSCVKLSDAQTYLKSGSYLGACNFSTSNQKKVTAEEPTGFSVEGFPNPSKLNFTLVVRSNNKKDELKVSVIDMYGRTIEQRMAPNEQTITLGDNYRPGVYIVNFMQGKETKQLKLIKLPN